MGDRAKKIVSARKKLNKFKQQKEIKNNQKDDELPMSKEQTPDESLTNSTHSSINEPTENTQLPNYFSTAITNNQASFFDDITDDKLEEHHNDKQTTMESLKQLSEEMSKLIEPPIVENTEISTEKRIQELTQLLNDEQLNNQKLQTKLDEAQKKSSEFNIENNEELKKDYDHLKKELQNHVQTIGILIGEKTELESNLCQYQLLSRQKTTECEELQARLKASRSRVAELERESNLLKNDKNQITTHQKQYQDTLDNLQKNYDNLKNEKDTLNEDLLEVREKLKESSEKNLELQQKIYEISSQLSMANLKIYQLTSGESQKSNEQQLEILVQEKFGLEKRIDDLNQTLKELRKEKDESSLQYHQYAQQLNSQLTNLAAKLDEQQKENEKLVLGEEERVKHISELERQLQGLQEQQILSATQKNNGDLREKLDETMKEFELVQNEREQLKTNLLKWEKVKNDLLVDLATKEETIKRLEEFVDDLRRNQPDNMKILATMESDKVAASRAMEQNAELKKQMEGIQEVITKLSDDKVELTDQLLKEQQSNRELLEKLQKTELHLRTLTDAIEIKDQELMHLQNNSRELDKKMFESEQLNDRLRHYEAQNNSSHVLQIELQEAKHQIVKLTNELNASKLDRNEDKTKLDDNCNSLDKESAMKHLEAKFLKTMDEIANLNEEKQRLEHLVLQLQSETETIGEYVTLYQHQRSLLKQKAIEKDQQLTQLAQDRKLIQDKLERLNDLVAKLVKENGALPSELLENPTNNLCNEHARIHSEINKITDENLKNKSDGINDEKSETAIEIIALLSEIKNNNLVQSNDNFHPCAWCSGQLITV